MHPLLLLGFGLFCFLGAACPALEDLDIIINAWVAGSSAIFLSAGRFILIQMKLWQNRALPIDELLIDTKIVDTSA